MLQISPYSSHFHTSTSSDIPNRPHSSLNTPDPACQTSQGAKSATGSWNGASRTRQPLTIALVLKWDLMVSLEPCGLQPLCSKSPIQVRKDSDPSPTKLAFAASQRRLFTSLPTRLILYVPNARPELPFKDKVAKALTAVRAGWEGPRGAPQPTIAEGQLIKVLDVARDVVSDVGLGEVLGIRMREETMEANRTQNLASEGRTFDVLSIASLQQVGITNVCSQFSLGENYGPVVTVDLGRGSLDGNSDLVQE